MASQLEPHPDIAKTSPRGSHSSDEFSILNDILPTTPNSRLFHVYNKRRRSDFAIYTAEKTPFAYVRCSSITIGKPDLTYHAGENEEGPIKATCKYVTFSRHCKIGLGDPDDPNIAWEDLIRHKLTTHYRFEITLEDDDTGSPKREAFVWKRTNSVGIGEDKPSKLSSKCFKLQNEATEEVIAVYLDGGLKTWKKCGKFQIDVDYGSVFDTMVFITGLGLLEKERRRERRSNY